MQCEPIGVARSPFRSHDEVPRQGHESDARGEIVIHPEYRDGLVGLTPGDSVLVVWFAHRADRTTIDLDRDSPRGVFTSRSQDRPNPICLTETEILSIEDGRLTVRGLDMLNDTPVLDLKPPLRR